MSQRRSEESRAVGKLILLKWAEIARNVSLPPFPPINSLSLDMSSQPLYARLAPLFESLKKTQQLITRLSKFPVQPGSGSSNLDEGDARVELGAEIHQSLKEQEEDFELLRQEVEDQTITSNWSSSARRRDSEKDSQRTDLAAQITRLGEDLKM